MERNYKKEYKEQKERYCLVKGYLDKNLGEKLKIILKTQNKTMSKWISENATKYINE